MIGKTWTITDEDGNHPKGEQLEKLCKWLTHEASRPIVGVKVNEHGTWFTFTETADRPTFATIAAEAKRLAHLLSDLQSFVSTVRLAIDAGDILAARKLFGHKE